MCFVQSCGQLCSVVQNVFNGNAAFGAGANGGGLYADTPGNLTVTDNQFVSNTAGTLSKHPGFLRCTLERMPALLMLCNSPLQSALAGPSPSTRMEGIPLQQRYTWIGTRSLTIRYAAAERAPCSACLTSPLDAMPR